jgi:hypothetical protein
MLLAERQTTRTGDQQVLTWFFYQPLFVGGHSLDWPSAKGVKFSGAAHTIAVCQAGT